MCGMFFSLSCAFRSPKTTFRSRNAHFFRRIYYSNGETAEGTIVFIMQYDRPPLGNAEGV